MRTVWLRECLHKCHEAAYTAALEIINVVKKPPTKAELRAQLDQQMANFIAQGGEIEQVCQGETGLQGREKPLHTPIFNQPSAQRTPVDDVVAALDQRRQSPKNSSARVKPSLQSRPRKKVIYDDFGEPLRKIWVEDKA